MPLIEAGGKHSDTCWPSRALPAGGPSESVRGVPARDEDFSLQSCVSGGQCDQITRQNPVRNGTCGDPGLHLCAVPKGAHSIGQWLCH